MSSAEIHKILEIGHDPWLGMRHRAEFLQLGKTLVPGNTPQHLSWKQRQRIVLNILSRRYDIIALGPFNSKRLIDLSRTARITKRFVACITKSEFLCKLSRRCIFGKRPSLVIFDIDDTSELSETGLKLFRPSIYFKRNLRQQDRDRSDQAVDMMPMAVRRPSYATIEKQTDLFVAGAYTKNARKNALEAARILASKGWTVDIVESIIPYGRYLKRLAQARAAFCLQGWGYHTWRMYEASLASTAPIIDLPATDIMHDFVGGFNCLVVDQPTPLMVEKIDHFLHDGSAVAKVAANARQLAEQKHTLEACADILYEKIRERIEGERNAVRSRIRKPD